MSHRFPAVPAVGQPVIIYAKGRARYAATFKHVIPTLGGSIEGIDLDTGARVSTGIGMADDELRMSWSPDPSRTHCDRCEGMCRGGEVAFGWLGAYIELDGVPRRVTSTASGLSATGGVTLTFEGIPHRTFAAGELVHYVPAPTARPFIVRAFTVEDGMRTSAITTRRFSTREKQLAAAAAMHGTTPDTRVLVATWDESSPLDDTRGEDYRGYRVDIFSPAAA